MGIGAILDWDDFRFFLALARDGSVRHAAKSLQVNPSTVTRRLERMESRLGVLLFTRSPQGLVMTDAGRDVIDQLEAVDKQLAAIEGGLTGRNQQLAGQLRLAVADVAGPLLPDQLHAFARQQPEVGVSVLPYVDAESLAKGEVDVLIQATENPAESMVGRPLGSIALAAYATAQYIKSHLNDPRSGQQTYVGLNTETAHAQMFDEHCQIHLGQWQRQMRCPHVFMQHACIAAGLGFGMLPCYIGTADARLEQLPDVPVMPSRTLWLLTHPDLRRVKRVALLMDFVREAFMQDEPRLSGLYL